MPPPELTLSPSPSPSLRKGSDRGFADHGWLKSYHSFSFAGYHDPAHMGFGPLRVINEDRVAPGMGFGTHGHSDMEIVSYVLEGELQHQDSLGNGSVIRPGDVQRMSAGTGVRHSEYNPSPAAGVHFLQIWIEPNVRGIAPSYEEAHFPAASKRGVLRLIAAGEPANGAVRIHQDAKVFAGLFTGSERADYTISPNRLAYVHLARGALTVNGQPLQAGDAMKLAGPGALSFEAGVDAEVLLFDLQRGGV